MATERPYRRRIFLINKRFQLRVALYVSSWIIALSFVYPLIVYNLFEYFVRYAAVDPMGPDLKGLFDTRQEVLLLMGATQVAFLLLTFLSSLFLAHRIAGPLFKLRKFFAQAREGRLGGDLYFRNYDHFPELAVEYNQMMGSIRDRLKGVADRIERTLPDTGPKAQPELQSIVSSIRKQLEAPPSS